MEILEYLNTKGYKIKRVGSVYRMICPYPDHKETEPSFTIYPKTNSFYCWGCKRYGSIINLMRLFGDTIPIEILEEEKNKRNKIKIKEINFKNKINKIRNIITLIRSKRKTYKNQYRLNQRLRKIMNFVKDLV